MNFCVKNSILLLFLTLLFSTCIAQSRKAEDNTIYGYKVTQLFPDIDNNGKLSGYDTLITLMYYYGDRVLCRSSYKFDSLDSKKRIVLSENRWHDLIFKKRDRYGLLLDKHKKVKETQVKLDSIFKTEWVFMINLFPILSENESHLLSVDTLKNDPIIVEEVYSLKGIKDTTMNGKMSLFYSKKLQNAKFSLSPKLDSIKQMTLIKARIYNSPRFFKNVGLKIDGAESGYEMEKINVDDENVLIGLFNMHKLRSWSLSEKNMTLFSYPKFTLDMFRNDYEVEMSAEFLNCADIQLSENFIKNTGLRFDKNLSLSWVSKEDFFYTKGIISKLPFLLYVNNNWNKMTICWTSKSGRIYNISDTVIDCNDIDFSFEHLDIDLYLKQLYPKINLPFKIKDISYNLKVTRLNIDATFKLIPKEDFKNGSELIVEEVNSFLNDFNLKSEENNRSEGVIHNFKVGLEVDNTIVYEIDMGSTGFPFLKKFLSFLSKMNKLSAVEIE